MNHWIMSGIIIVLFYISPLIGVWIIINDIIRSRNRGKELDIITDGLRDRFELLNSSDIAGFDASLSNWLEVEIRNPTTNWIRASLRLFTQAKLIGLGEGHREILLRDDHYRGQVLEYGQLLIDSFENGNREEVMKQISNLFVIFLCKNCDEKSVDEMNTSAVERIVLEALTQAANRIQEGYLDSDRYITNALKTITAWCVPEKAGLPILLLQWANLKVSHRYTRSSKLFSLLANPTQELSKQFLTVVSLYRQKDIAGIFDVVSKSF